MKHEWDAPEEFRTEMGLPAFMICKCGRKWWPDRPMPKDECPGKRESKKPVA